MKTLFTTVCFLVLCLTAIAAFSADKVVVVPLAANSVNKGLVPIAVGSAAFNITGLDYGFGVESVLEVASGEYLVTLEGTINTVNPIVLVTPYTGDFGTPEIAGYEPISSNSFKIRIQDAQGSPRASAFSFVVYDVVSLDPLAKRNQARSTE